MAASSYKPKAVKAYNNIPIKEKTYLHFGQTHNGVWLEYNFQISFLLHNCKM